MDDFIPEQEDTESRLTYALYSGLRSDTRDEMDGWRLIAEVLAMSCTPAEVELAKVSALGKWLEELNLDWQTTQQFFED